jgi:hypothetical protein
MWTFPNISLKDMLLDSIKDAIRKQLVLVILYRRLARR